MQQAGRTRHWRPTDPLLEIKELEIQENSEDSMAWESKGRVLFKMGEYEEAIEAFDRSIEVSPGLVCHILGI